MRAVAPAVAELFDLRGKVAFVSGASGEIGSGIARRLAEAHVAVAVHYRGGRDGAAAVVAAIAEAGGKAVAVQAELTEPAAAEAAVEFVNNAARQTHARFEDMDLDEWRGMLSANLDGVFILTKLVAAQMIGRASSGAIVNIHVHREDCSRRQPRPLRCVEGGAHHVHPRRRPAVRPSRHTSQRGFAGSEIATA